MQGEYYYRFESLEYEEGDIELSLYNYPIIRKTKCCVFILVNNKEKRILERRWSYNGFENVNKKWACPSIKEALFSFIKRKERQIQILKYQLSFIERSLDIAKQKYSEEV